MSEEGYREAVSEIQSEWKKLKKSRNQAHFKELMETTYTIRRKWIAEEHPLVSDVIEKFPCLASTKVVSMNLLLQC